MKNKNRQHFAKEGTYSFFLIISNGTLIVLKASFFQWVDSNIKPEITAGE